MRIAHSPFRFLRKPPHAQRILVNEDQFYGRKLTGSVKPPLPNRAETSRWHRPKLYVTIVAFYLLTSVTVALVLGWYDLARYRNELSEAHVNPGFGALFILFMYVWLAIISIPAIVGPAKWLISVRKIGIYVCLAGLVLMTISLPVLIGIFFTAEGFDAETDLVYTGTFYSSLIISLAMYPLLIIGWKRYGQT